jgi:5-methylcytosine-specific restriction endonuclease McrA
MHDAAAHEIVRHLTEVVDVPEHAPREESEEFRKNREYLLREQGLGCWVCGTREDLEVHHLIEWALWPGVDVEKAQETLRALAFYPWTGRDVKDADSLGNLLVLCKRHHRGKEHGVHAVTFPIWIVQRCQARDMVGEGLDSP